MSGSGKSVALGALEDSGYYAVNNLPVPLLVDTVAHLASARAHARRARARRRRPGRGSPALPTAIAQLRAAGWTVRFLYLDAKTDTLVKRFSETRRRHPFSSDDRARCTEAIDYERDAAGRRARAGLRRSTRASCRPAALRALDQGLRAASTRRKLTLLFESFGFKHGVPLDADLVFDVRCLPNPHYEPELRPLTGRDAAGRRVPRDASRGRAHVRRHLPLRRRAGCPTTRATTATT